MKMILAFLLGIACMFAIAAAQKQTLEGRVRQLEKDVMTLIIGEAQKGQARININEQGYSIAETKFGSFAFLLRDVEAFASGTKVSLEILNLCAAKFTDCSLDITWRTKGKPVTTTHSVLKTLTPGVWVADEIKTTAVKPADIVGMAIEISPKTVEAFHQ